MSVVRDIGAALGLLTVVPVRTQDGARPVRWFPAVGWLYGATALGIASAAVALESADGLGALLTAVIIVGAWALLSGFLHWDGLADVADGMGARGDADARLGVMRDSSTGAFGVIAIVLVALVEVAAVALIVESRSWWALAGAPVVGRFGAAAALIQTKPARPDGLAARYAGPESFAGVLVIIAALLPLLLFPFDHARFVAALAGVLVSQIVPIPFVHRLGGITGDVLGATVLLTESFVLVWGAVVGGLV